MSHDEIEVLSSMEIDDCFANQVVNALDIVTAITRRVSGRIEIASEVDVNSTEVDDALLGAKGELLKASLAMAKLEKAGAVFFPPDFKSIMLDVVSEIDTIVTDTIRTGRRPQNTSSRLGAIDDQARTLSEMMKGVRSEAIFQCLIEREQPPMSGSQDELGIFEKARKLRAGRQAVQTLRDQGVLTTDPGEFLEKIDFERLNELLRD